MEEAGTVDKVDELRRAGLYLGPVILGSMAGNGLYGAACGGPSFVMGVSANPLVLRVAFVIGGVVLACRMKEPIGRVALLVFAVHQGILAYASVTGVGLRSEERRVGKECRSRWERDQEKKKTAKK